MSSARMALRMGCFAGGHAPRLRMGDHLREHATDVVVGVAQGCVFFLLNVAAGPREVDPRGGLRCLRIGIFLNVFDVHVNRYPVSGTVRYVHYNPGKFGHA